MCCFNVTPTDYGRKNWPIFISTVLMKVQYIGMVWVWSLKKYYKSEVYFLDITAVYGQSTVFVQKTTWSASYFSCTYQISIQKRWDSQYYSFLVFQSFMWKKNGTIDFISYFYLSIDYLIVFINKKMKTCSYS